MKFIIKPLLVAMLFSAIKPALALTADPLSITPDVSSLNFYSNRDESVIYTITNNMTQTLPKGITINLSSKSGGTTLSLQDDHCSEATLSAGQSCTFNVLIPGANQSTQFNIVPTVCLFSGALCRAGDPVAVTVMPRILPTRIYQVNFTNSYSSPDEKLVGINTAAPSDIISANIPNPVLNDGPLAVSPDGSKVYVLHKLSNFTYQVLTFSIAGDSITQLTNQTYAITYNDVPLSSPGEMTITPDGNTLYIANNSASHEEYPVYRIDLTASDYQSAVTGLTDSSSDQGIDHIDNIAASADNKSIYISNAYPVGSRETNNVYAFTNALATTSISQKVFSTDLTHIAVIRASLDNKYIYVGGQLGSGSFPATIEKYDNQNSFSKVASFTPDATANGTTQSLALAADDQTLYALMQNDGSYFRYAINTSDMTGSTGINVPYQVYFFLWNSPALDIAGNDSMVAILNYGDNGDLTALYNPATPENVTTVNPSQSDDIKYYTNTNGDFIN